MLTRKQISLIHVAKTKLGMDDDEYRAMLSRFGAMSSTELKPAQFEECLKLMRGWGFVGKDAETGRKGDAETPAGKPAPVDDKSRLVGKIGALLKALDLPWSYADGCAMNMFRVRKVKWLNADQLRRVVAALVIHQKRKKSDLATDAHGRTQTERK